MNQAILFPDRQEWNDASQSILFPALFGGTLIQCLVSVDYLERLSAIKSIDKESGIEVFLQYRFDIEEIAEDLIENEQFDSFGQVIIS